MAARAVVCALLLGVSVAHADDKESTGEPGKRPVAVIDLEADDAGLLDLATNIEVALQNHPALTQVVSAIGGPLHDVIPDEDDAAKVNAKRYLKDADDALASFEFKTAGTNALLGEEALVGVTPTRAAPIYAELALVLGQARLGSRDPKGAAEAFALVHLLAPEHPLDPARYLPEVVAAYDKATPPTATRTIDVDGSGRVWIDGREVGAAPGTFTVSLGAHLVQLAGPERPTAGREVTVVADDPKAPKPIAIPIADAALAPTVLLHRARTLLGTASDSLARAGAMAHLASLVHVQDAILLSRNAATGAITYETWHDGTFTAATPLGKEPPSAILDVIEPPKPPPLAVAKKFYPIPLPHETPWWQRPRYIGPIAGGIVGIVVTGLLLSRGQGSTMYDGHIAGRGPNW